MTILYLLSEVEDKPCAYIGFQLVPYLNGRLIVQHGRTLGLKGDHMLDRLPIICMFGLFALSLSLFLMCIGKMKLMQPIKTNQTGFFNKYKDRFILKMSKTSFIHSIFDLFVFKTIKTKSNLCSLNRPRPLV